MVLTCNYRWSSSWIWQWMRQRHYLWIIVVVFAANCRFVVIDVHLFLFFASSWFQWSPQLGGTAVDDYIEGANFWSIDITTLILCTLIYRVYNLALFACKRWFIQLIQLIYQFLSMGMIFWRDCLWVIVGILDIEFELGRF